MFIQKRRYLKQCSKYLLILLWIFSKIYLNFFTWIYSFLNSVELVDGLKVLWFSSSKSISASGLCKVILSFGDNMGTISLAMYLSTSFITSTFC